MPQDSPAGQNCYVYWDGDEVPEAERRIHVQCSACQQQNGRGLFWPAWAGYGDKQIVCECGAVINPKRTVANRKV